MNRSMRSLFAIGMLFIGFAGPGWAEEERLTLAFSPGGGLDTSAVSPEGCYYDHLSAAGTLAAPEAGHTCHNGVVKVDSLSVPPPSWKPPVMLNSM